MNNTLVRVLRYCSLLKYFWLFIGPDVGVFFGLSCKILAKNTLC